MITSKVKRWGNSFGFLISRREAQRLHLRENQQVIVDIIEVENPLKELFGFSKQNKISKEEFAQVRKLLESTRI